jgi:hypothetical protein
MEADMNELPPEDKALLSKIVDLGERRRRTSKRSSFTREQLVSAMNEKYCWLDDEKAIFDLQNFVTRKRDQVHLDMSNLFAIEEVEGKEKVVSAFSAWSTSPERLHYAGRRFSAGLRRQECHLPGRGACQNGF